jgi:hypothetical protein
MDTRSGTVFEIFFFYKTQFLSSFFFKKFEFQNEENPEKARRDGAALFRPYSDPIQTLFSLYSASGKALVRLY